MEWTLVVLVVIAGGVLRGYTGFGHGLLVAPLLTLVWGPVDAVAATVGLGMVATVQLAGPAIPVAKWRETGPLIAGVVLATPLGTYVLVSLDPDAVKRIIAAAVLVMAAITLGGWSYRGPRGTAPGLVVGAIGAVINGIAAVGGPPLVLYLMALPDGPKIQRANIVVTMGIMPAVAFVAMAFAGAVTAGTLVRIAVLALPFVASVWGGSRLFHILPERMFRLAVLWMLIVMSVVMLVA